MRFGYVAPPYGALWPSIADLLDSAVRRGKNEWGDVIETLIDGRAQLWLTVDGEPVNATVTRMDGTTLEVWLCGGRVLGEALGFLETILIAAREAGATDARIVGRKGWSRVLAPFGWTTVGDELVKDWR